VGNIILPTVPLFLTVVPVGKASALEEPDSIPVATPVVLSDVIRGCFLALHDKFWDFSSIWPEALVSTLISIHSTTHTISQNWQMKHIEGPT